MSWCVCFSVRLCRVVCVGAAFRPCPWFQLRARGSYRLRPCKATDSAVVAYTAGVERVAAERMVAQAKEEADKRERQEASAPFVYVLSQPITPQLPELPWLVWPVHGYRVPNPSPHRWVYTVWGRL